MSNETITALVQALIPLILAVNTIWVVPLLRRLKAKSEAQHKGEEVRNAGDLMARLKTFLLGQAHMIAEERFPKLAKQVEDGSLTDEDHVQYTLGLWGQQLVSDAYAYFHGQGVDLNEYVSREQLYNLVRRAADAASPFPGMQTSKAILNKDLRDLLLELGVDYTRVALHKRAEAKSAQPTTDAAKQVA